MANKQMKITSVEREMQIKITAFILTFFLLLPYCYTSPEFLGYMKKTTSSQDIGQLELPHTADGNVKLVQPL